MRLARKTPLISLAAIIVIFFLLTLNPFSVFKTKLKPNFDEDKAPVPLNQELVVSGVRGTEVVALTLFDGEQKVKATVKTTGNEKRLQAKLKENRRYRLEVKATPMLGSEVTTNLYFKTVDYLKLTAAEGDEKVLGEGETLPAPRNFKFTFDKPVRSARVKLSGKYFQAAIDKNDRKKVAVTTGNAVPQGTKVKVNLEATAEDGSSLESRENILFNTLDSPKLSTSTPLIGAKLQSRSGIEIIFSKSMDNQFMASLISAKSGGKKLPFSLQWGRDGRKLTVVPQNPWPETKINLTIAAGAKAADGSWLARDLKLVYNYPDSTGTDNDSNIPVTPVSTTGKSIVVVYHSNRMATVYAYNGGKLIRQIGAYGPAKGYRQLRGTFRVGYHVNPLHSTKYGPYDLHYWMTISGNYGFHGHKVDRNTGQQLPNYSHGCIAMDHGDASWLYNWTPTGTKVTLK